MIKEYIKYNPFFNDINWNNITFRLKENKHLEEIFCITNENINYNDINDNKDNNLIDIHNDTINNISQIKTSTDKYAYIKILKR